MADVYSLTPQTVPLPLRLKPRQTLKSRQMLKRARQLKIVRWRSLTQTLGTSNSRGSLRRLSPNPNPNPNSYNLGQIMLDTAE